MVTVPTDELRHCYNSLTFARGTVRVLCKGRFPEKKNVDPLPRRLIAVLAEIGIIAVLAEIGVIAVLGEIGVKDLPPIFSDSMLSPGSIAVPSAKACLPQQCCRFKKAYFN